MSGTNAHLLVEEAPVRPPADDPGLSACLFLFSARTEKALQRLITRMVSWLEQTGQDHQPADLAYTLGVRRSRFAVRTAVVASSLTELRQHLIALRDGDHSAPVVRNLKKHPATPDPERDRKAAMARYLVEESESACRERLQEFGACFVEGSAPASTLWDDGKRRVISLPAYPFERMTCRIERDITETQVSAPLHPLVHRNTSTLEGVRFRTTLSSSAFYLADHVLDGQPVFPGAAYLELVRAAGTLAAQKPVTTIRNLIWPAPIRMESTTRDIETRLQGNPDTPDFQVLSHSGSAGSVCHARGRLEFDAPEMPPTPELAALRGRCTNVLDPKKIYERFTENHLAYGPHFRCLREVRHSGDEVYAVLELSVAVERENAIMFHPGMVDAVLQTIIAFRDSEIASDVIFMPFSIGTVHFYAPLSGRCVVHTRMNRRGNNFLYHMNVASEDGTPLMQIQDFLVRAVPAHQEGEPIASRTEHDLPSLPDISPAVVSGTHNIEEQPVPRQESVPQDLPQSPVGQHPASSDTRPQIDAIYAQLRTMVTRLLAVAEDAVWPDGAMSDYGFDSLAITSLADLISQTFSLDLTPADLFEHATLREMAEYIRTRLPQPLQTQAPVTPASAEIRPMSDTVTATSRTQEPVMVGLRTNAPSNSTAQPTAQRQADVFRRLVAIVVEGPGGSRR